MSNKCTALVVTVVLAMFAVLAVAQISSPPPTQLLSCAKYSNDPCYGLSCSGGGTNAVACCCQAPGVGFYCNCRIPTDCVTTSEETCHQRIV